MSLWLDLITKLKSIKKCQKIETKTKNKNLKKNKKQTSINNCSTNLFSFLKNIKPNQTF